MRIGAATADGAAVDLDQVDLADVTVYTGADQHRLWQVLRSEQPVFWHRARSRPGFWVVTRHADVRRVLRDHEAFTSEQGTALDMLGSRDLAAGRMMHATDPPCHRLLREPIERPLAARAVAGYTGLVRSVVQELLRPVQEVTEWDAAAVFTHLPIEVMARLMALPAADVPHLLRLAYASVAPQDPRYRNGSVAETYRWAHSGIVDYFHRLVRDRRASPGPDLLSHLATLTVHGQVLPEEDVVLNCFSLLVGGVVTTAQVICATMVAMVDSGHGEGCWPASGPGASFVEEALRWASPTTHFMRYARRDVALAGGGTVRQGDPVTAWIASANRDEAVFPRPYTFDPLRRPNRHLAFGSGAHRCVGRQLARVMLREAFQALRCTVESFEVAGEPTHLASNLIAGMVELPVRSRPRPAG